MARKLHEILSFACLRNLENACESVAERLELHAVKSAHLTSCTGLTVWFHHRIYG